MALSIENSFKVAGYDEPRQLLTRTAWMCAAFALATIAGRLFDPKLHLKSHFTFGQVSSVTINLLHYNRYLGNLFSKNSDPQKKDVLMAIFFLMHCILPIVMGRMITNLCFKKISWIQAGKRELYLGVSGLVILCASELYKREKKKQGS